MDSLLSAAVGNPLDGMFGEEDNNNQEKKPKVDVRVAQAEVERQAREDAAARAEGKERRKTEHETRAAAMRDKYGLKDPNADDGKDKKHKRKTEPAISTSTPAEDSAPKPKEKWYKKIFS